MARHFAPISTEELKAKCLRAFSPGGASPHIAPCEVLEKLSNDIKVRFDSENFETEGYFGPAGLTGLVSLGNGLTFWGMCAGGDWESPVFFIVYWDGRNIRAYVPTEGNPWNTDTMEAFGNDDAADLANARKRWPEEFEDAKVGEFELDFSFCEGAILKDILSRLTAKKGK